MPRRPSPAPPELDLVRDLAEELARAEAEVDRLRAARNHAMQAAKRAGATGDQLGAAARMSRRKAVDIVGDGRTSP